MTDLSKEIYDFLKENHMINQIEDIGFDLVSDTKFTKTFGEVEKVIDGGKTQFANYNVWCFKSLGLYVALEIHETSSLDGTTEKHYIFSSDDIILVYPEEITEISWEHKLLGA